MKKAYYKSVAALMQDTTTESSITEINNNKISDIEFMSKYIQIINKQKKRQKLELNEIQLKIENKIKELRDNNIAPRIIILKARQEGVTTYSQGKMISNCVQNKDMNCLIVSHQQDSTNAIFSKSKFMYENLPDNVKPLNKASNARELVFDTPRAYKGELQGLNSKIVVKIAGKESIGRSDTYSFVHMSEFAFWSGRDDNSPESQLAAIMQALPETVDSLAIIESTAKGFNSFKDVWDKAIAGENGWTPLFFAWHDDKNYSREFENVSERINFENSLDQYEKEILEKFDLKLEQINWYRYTKRVKCNNNADKMKQENPSFPEEAFIFSGIPVFDNSIVMNQINYLKKLYKIEKPIVGKFKYIMTNNLIIDESIKFVKRAEKNSNIIVKIYEKVKKGYYYTIGADTKGEGKDYYTATVVNTLTQKVAATIYADLSNSKPFTLQLYCLGKYYNYALISVEINFNTAPVEKLLELKYFKQYQRERKDDFTGKLMKKYGWKTDGITRPLMIDNHIDFSNKNIECFAEIKELDEMLTFVYDKNGKPDAMAGKHDDLLFSHMIANECLSQQSRRIDNEHNFNIYIEDNVKKDNKVDPLDSFWM